jgi:hypothetical protein
MRVYPCANKNFLYTYIMSQESSPLPYRLRQEFFSPAEAAFYRVLHDMVKDRLYVFPKVSLQDLFFVTRPNENVHYFNKIYRKAVDFALLRPNTLKPILAIELDYPKQTGHRQNDTFMDDLFAAANLPLVHVTVQQTYDIAALAMKFSETLKKIKEENPLNRHADYSPTCPRCGITMVLRIYRTGAYAGQQYYGCLNYPTCQETMPVAVVGQ